MRNKARNNYCRDFFNHFPVNSLHMFKAPEQPSNAYTLTFQPHKNENCFQNKFKVTNLGDADGTKTNSMHEDQRAFLLLMDNCCVIKHKNDNSYSDS